MANKLYHGEKSLKITKGYPESVNRKIEDRQTDNTMAKQKKIQKDKQRSTKHTHKTKTRVTRTPLKIRGELRCCGGKAVPASLVAPVVLI
jgi:hypothetical protein